MKVFLNVFLFIPALVLHNIPWVLQLDYLFKEPVFIIELGKELKILSCSQTEAYLLD